MNHHQQRLDPLSIKRGILPENRAMDNSTSMVPEMSEPSRKVDSRAVEWLLQCPLSFEQMEDPVVVFPSGHSYDRKSICQSLLHFPNLDPKSGLYYDKPLRYTTNFALRNILQDMQALVPYDDSGFAEAYTKAWRDKVAQEQSVLPDHELAEMRQHFPGERLVHRIRFFLRRHVFDRTLGRFGKQRVVQCVLLLFILVLTACICSVVFESSAKERLVEKENMLCSRYRIFSPAEAWYYC